MEIGLFSYHYFIRQKIVLRTYGATNLPKKKNYLRKKLDKLKNMTSYKTWSSNIISFTTQVRTSVHYLGHRQRETGS